MSANKKAMIVSVGTGKEGKDIAHGICFSLQHHHPNFIVFLTTAKSKETTMPFVIEHCNHNQRLWKEKDLTDAEDVEKIVIECQEVIRGLKNEGYHINSIVADYTSGTKAMSAGLTIAAIREKIGILTYTTGKRGEGGRVISGTERVLSLIPNQIYAEDLFREAVDSFNTYHFDVALKIIAEVKVRLSDPDFLNKLDLLKDLCMAYAAWDRFEIARAFEILKALGEKPLLHKWQIDKQIGLNKQALYQEKEKLFCQERTFDLMENAKRRGDEEHKYDDAVARLYRVCEYIGQFEIFKKELYKTTEGRSDTSDLDISRLPETLREKYLRYKDSYDGKVKLHLSGNYELLNELNHPLGAFFKQEQKRFKKLMGLRDLSILAHGFNPISEETYKDMLRLVEELNNRNGMGDIEIGKKVRFPKIKFERE